MSEQLRSLRHERDVREHGDAVTTRPWWNAPGEESRALPAEDLFPFVIHDIDPKRYYILANPRPFT